MYFVFSKVIPEGILALAMYFVFSEVIPEGILALAMYFGLL